MLMERFLGIAGVILGLVTLGFGSFLLSQGAFSYFQPSTSPTTSVLLDLTGQTLGDGRDRTFDIPLIVRPSVSLTVSVSSTGPVNLAIYDSNGPLVPSGMNQNTHTITFSPSYDTIASIEVSNVAVGSVTFTLRATESYTSLTQQTSQVHSDAGYMGMAAGVGLLLLGITLLLQKNRQAISPPR